MMSNDASPTSIDLSEYLPRLQLAGQQLHQTPDLQACYALTCQLARTVSGVDYAAYFSCESGEADSLILVGEDALHSPLPSDVAEYGLSLAKTARQQRSVYLPPPETHPIPAFHDWLLLPVPLHDASLGVLCLAHTTPNAFSKPLLAVLEVYATQVALAIDAYRLRTNGTSASTTDMSIDKPARLLKTSHEALIGRLAASVAHEINNPLTISLTNAQILMLDLDPNDELYQLVEDIQHSNSRIREIVANLVEMAHFNVGSFAEVDLIESIEQAIDLLGPTLRRAKVSLVRDYADRPLVWASRSQLKMVWTQLLSNARDAILVTRQSGTIKIQVRLEPQMCTVRIGDNGVGITDTDRPHLFDPFFSRQLVPNAIGLGLWHVQQLLQGHEAEIHLESRTNDTTFSVSFPMSSTA